MNIKDKILQYASFALVFLTPLLYWQHRLYAYITSKTFFIYGMVEILFFFWIYCIYTDSKYRLSKKTLIYFIPLLGFIAWLTLSSITAYNTNLAFWGALGRGTGLLTLFHLLAFSIVVASIVSKYGINYINNLLKWFVASSFILAISVWLGTDGLHTTFSSVVNDNGGGLAGNSTLTATVLLFSIAAALFVIFRKNSKFIKYFSLITIIVIVLSPLFLNICGLFNGHGLLGSARGTILALISGLIMACCGYMFLSNKKQYKYLSLSFLFIGFVVFVIAWMQLVTPGTSLHNKFAQEARGSRFIFWDTAQKAVDEHPLVGYGPENYSIAFQKYFNPDVLLTQNSMEGWADKAHNMYYDIGVSGGYPAIVLYGIFLLVILYCIYKSYIDKKFNHIQASVLIGLIFAYIINNLFTFDSNLSYMMLFMFVGIIFSCENIHNDKIKNSNNYLLLTILVIVFFPIWIYFSIMPSSKARVFSDVFSMPINTRSESYTKLLGSPHVGEQWDASSLAYDSYRNYLSNAQAIKSNKQILPYAINDVSALLDYLDNISKDNKTDYRLYITIIYLQNTLTYLTDRPYTPELKDRLLSVLDKAQKLSPNNPNVYWGIAQAKVWSGDFTGTEEAYRKALEVAPQLPGSYTLFMKYAQALGNQKLFNEIASQAQKNIVDFKYN